MVNISILVIFIFVSFPGSILTEGDETNSTKKDRFHLYGQLFPAFNPQFARQANRPFNSQCVTGNGKSGQCIPLQRCPYLRELAENGFTINNFRCAYSPSVTFVCCAEPEVVVPITWPDDSPPATPKPTRVPPRQPETTTSQPVTTTASRENRDQHPNRRLLPETECGVDNSFRVLGGTEAALDEFSWMALLRYRFTGGRTVFGCGGSLINDRYVLTAAHCLKSNSLPPNVIVDVARLGEHDLNNNIDCINGKCNNPPLDAVIEERIIHPQYDPDDDANYNDIALLRLRDRVKYSLYINPICLPLDSLRKKKYVGQTLDVAGWGRTANMPKSNSPLKLKVGLPVLDTKSCEPFYRRNGINLIESQICAGGESGRDSCQGDSGGPLMSSDVIGSEIRWHVTGIVSFGPPKCGEVNNPAIYTRVSSFVDWIMDNLQE